MKSSYNLMMEGKQNILFLDLLDIIKMKYQIGCDKSRI